MSLFSALSRTLLGKWMRKQQDASSFGGLIKRISRTLRNAEQRVVAMWPAHVQHDRQQRAILRAFERQTKPRTADPGLRARSKAPAE